MSNLNKLFCTAFLLLLGFVGVSAQEDNNLAVMTFDFNVMDVATSSSGSSDGDITETLLLTEGDVKLFVSPKEGNVTENRFWGTSNGPQLRVYSGTLTFDVPIGKLITKIIFKGSRWNNSNSADIGEFDYNIWTGNAETVVVYIAGNTQINSIEVTIAKADAPQSDLSEAQAVLRAAIKKVKAYNISELDDAIAAAEAALNAEDATLQSLAAAGQALETAVKDYAKTTLVKAVELAGMINNGELNDVIAEANIMLTKEDTTGEELLVALVAIKNKTLPMVSSLLKTAKEFAYTYDYTDLIQYITAAETAVVGGDFDQIKNSITILGTNALVYTQEALGIVDGYANVMGDADLTAAVQKAQSDMSKGLYLALIADMQDIAIKFKAAADTIIKQIQAIDTDGKKMADELQAALTIAVSAMQAENTTIANIGEAIINLVQVYKAYVKANEYAIDADGYYLLSSADDWKAFAAIVEETPTANARMTADIDLGDDQTMIAPSLSNSFSGTFDGQGHTLTVNYNNSNSGYRCAPFVCTYGATIRNLHVKGNVVGPNHSSGLVANYFGGTSVIENCHVSTIVTATGYYVGGILGHGHTTGEPNTFKIIGCLFDGNINKAVIAGAVVGWCDNTKLKTVKDCVEFGSYNNCSNIGLNQSNSGLFDIENSYFSKLWSEGGKNGKHAYSVTSGQSDLMFDFGTPTVVYDVSGITAYETGLSVGGVRYAGSGETIRFKVFNTSGQHFAKVEANGIELTPDADGTYSLTLEAKDYVITASSPLPLTKEVTVTVSSTTVTEGETFHLTVTLPEPAKEATTVSITSEHPKLFSHPQTATVKAGESTVTIEVTAVDDDIPGLDIPSTFFIYVPGFEKKDVSVILHDNDLPALELALTPDRVKESDGPISVTATLRRTTNKDSKITVKLSDDANGGLYLGQTTLELAKGVDELHFNLGPVDNAQADGDRTYTVTAAVWISSCSCSATGQAAGSVSAELNVYDDDGPALSMSSQNNVVKEGSETVLTIRRNTSTEKPLTVTLSSNHDELLEYDHNVTIAAGKSEASCTVKAVKNNVTDDSKTIVFTVQGEGFNSGTCWLMVTDQTLPDARITNFTADKNEETVGGYVTMEVTVVNDGVTPLPKELPVKIFKRGSAHAIATLYTEDEIAPGAEMTLTRVVIMPTQTGETVFYAVVNEGGSVKEISTANNTSAEVRVNITSPFMATLISDKQRYVHGEKVIFSGQLTGKATANTNAEIYIINGGVRQTITVTTDDSGRFTHQWTPYTHQMGHFIAGVCYPGEEKTEAMVTIDIYGLKRQDSGFITCDVTTGEPYIGNITLVNPGVLKLTNVNVVATHTPEGCTLNLDLANTIDGGKTAELKYTITGTSPTAKKDWEKIPVSVTTAEGATLDLTLYYYCRPAKAQMEVSETVIKTTMTKGKTRDYKLSVTNIGRGNTGDITLSLPSWIKSASGLTLPSLQQNESTTIVLQLTPTYDMQLNVPVTGYLSINSKNGNSVRVDFNITPVSEENGSLVVDVCDEKTYYYEDKPHVEGAEVVVRNPITQELVAQGITSADGIYAVNLPEGYYHLSVSAKNHDAYSNVILVSPGTETMKTVNLSLKAIDISFGVVQTEVEDQYKIVTNVTYQTNVPVPVVLLEGPDGIDGADMQEGDEELVTFTLVNKGLIKAQNVNLYLPVPGNGWEMEALSSTGPFTLAPQQSVDVAVVVRKTASASGSRMPAKSNAGDTLKEAAEDGLLTTQRCYASMVHEYEYLCGDSVKNNKGVRTFIVNTCIAGGILEALSDLVVSMGLDKLAYTPQANPTPPNNNDKQKEGDGNGSESNQGIISIGTDKFLSFCNPDDVDCAAAVVKSLLGHAKNLPAKTINKLTEFSEALQEYQEEREKAQEEGKPVDDVDKKFVQDKLKSGMKDCMDIIKEAQEKLNGEADEADGSVMETVRSFAKDALDIALACEKSYNRLHPRDAEGRGDKMQTFYDAYHLYEDIKEIGEELFGVDKWLELGNEDMMAFMDYLLSIDITKTPIEEIFAHAPESVTLEECRRLSERIVNTVERYKFVKGEFDYNFRRKAMAMAETQDGNYINLDSIFAYTNEIDSLNAKARAEGYESMHDMVIKVYQEYVDFYTNPSEHVCAKVKLQFSQSMAMTREAFRGTLTVFNGHEDTAMTDVKLTMLVTREDGTVATPHEFQINAETKNGFDGELALDAGWTLNAQQTGVATILFIPTKYAAPAEPVKWTFGGIISYMDPFTGREVRSELYPVTLTVNPSPNLELTYFMQRDIFGDDPLTKNLVEPVVPAEFALLINNKGEGEARNVKMTTQQPEIIYNEKELAVQFSIVSSQVNGQPATLSFGQTIANDFGNIPAHSQAYGQWWLESSLLGRFNDYDVSVNHLTSYGNPDLSIVDTISIHELTHGFTVPVTNDGKALRGWLVNDIKDSDDMPDVVYFSDATKQLLHTDANVSIAQKSQTEYVLTLTPTVEGWQYGSLPDPTNGTMKVSAITRQSDGTRMPLDNVWQTDRTLHDGQDPLYENRLHFVAYTDGSSDSYLVTFKMGDANNDDAVDVADIATIISYMAGQTDGISEKQVDVNKDGAVDVADIATVISIMAEQARLLGIMPEKP